MKKFIFGCILMLCGIIGGTGWLIARVAIVEAGAWSTVFNVFDFCEIECYIILLFYALAIVGTVIALKSINGDKRR